VPSLRKAGRLRRWRGGHRQPGRRLRGRGKQRHPSWPSGALEWHGAVLAPKPQRGLGRAQLGCHQPRSHDRLGGQRERDSWLVQPACAAQRRLAGASPADAVHIGDRPEKDAAGPHWIGMRAIRVRTGEYAAVPDGTPPPDLSVSDAASAMEAVRAAPEASGVPDAEGAPSRSFVSWNGGSAGNHPARKVRPQACPPPPRQRELPAVADPLADRAQPRRSIRSSCRFQSCAGRCRWKVWKCSGMCSASSFQASVSTESSTPRSAQLMSRPSRSSDPGAGR
jgi:hypothetical protein